MNISGTLRSSPGDNAMTICYSIGAVNSKAWNDGKPNTGIHTVDVARTLDSSTCCDPARNQGGIAVVEIHSTGTSSK